MPKFHKLTVHDVRRETSDCVSISFAVPDSLRQDYIFQPGQHLTLRAMLGGEDVRRSYSICSCPSNGELRVAVKQVSGGQFSTFANESIQPGSELDVMTPMGNFSLKLKPAAQRQIIAFAAGSGITPIISMIKALLKTEPESQFMLFYGNKNEESVIFREELEGLKNEYLTRLSVHYILSQEDPGSELFHGRIDGEKCRKFATLLFDPQKVDAFYLCGPETMIEAVKDALLSLGVDEGLVHFELFTTPESKSVQKANAWVPSASHVAAKITVTLDGKTFNYDHISPSEKILDAARRTGADLPYACKGGVCCTCKAKLLKGDVDMEVCYGLEKEEIDAGYVLTCQAHPRTPEVVISFDE